MMNLVLDLLLLLFLSSFPSLHQACNHLDQDSILSFNFDVYSDPPLNWSSSVDCCLWEGIICDADGYVTRLWLPWRGLSGSISPAIGNLTHLSHINLSHNLLSGPLPASSFLSLILLETLDLSHNRLSGEFPSSSMSTHIRIVDLSSNGFQGIIPPTIFQLMRNLISFNVSNNSFTGLIPSSAWIDSFCSIRVLDFSYNKFSGQVPPGMGNCSRLQIFRAGYNSLSGSLPYDIYSATSIEDLSVPNNHFSGPISNDIIHLKNLTRLDLYSNQLTGSLPKDIGKLTNLKYLLLHMNNLSGSLPPSMMNCSNLKTLNLRVNLFAGNLSAFNFSMLPRLGTVDLGNNMFSGSFPSTLTSCRSLTAVRLASNQLEGQISPEIVKLKSLSFLSTSDNHLTNITGAIRILLSCKNLSILILSKNFMNEEIPNDDQIKFSYGFQKLKILGLGGCQLTGQIPLWLGKLRNLQVLDLSVNQIKGSIPGWLGNLPSLFNIDLSHNLISGAFPKELSGLQALVSNQKQVNRSYLELPVFGILNTATTQQYNNLFNFPLAIFLRNNSLSGTIPTEIGLLKFVHVLDLSHNNFSGSIPDQISQLTNLERLDLSGNHLSGEIPESLGSLSFLSSFSVAENNLVGPIPSTGQFHTFPTSGFEGNPGLCGATVQRPCTIKPRMSKLAEPNGLSNLELHYGLVAGVVFGFIIGSTSGLLYPLRRIMIQQSLRERVMPLRDEDNVMQ